MKIHPRERIVHEAEAHLLEAIAHTIEGLTEAEALRVVNGVCSSWIASVAKYAIREERHGNTDTPGGLAKDEGAER